MVDIPDDDAGKQPPPPKRTMPHGQPAPGLRPPTNENRRVPTGEAKRPPTAESKQLPDSKKTGPVEQGGPKRRTQILSLEPPKRNRGPGVMRDARMDGMAGPNTQSARNRSLMGNIGREKTNPVPKQAAPQQSIAKPSLRRTDDGKPVDLGGDSKKDMETMVIRRGGTRRIPKAGGGFQGEAPVMDSMGSGRRPSVDPGPSSRGDNVPPVVNMPVPRANVSRAHQAPPPPSARGNTLAGVSAEELLGEEGKKMLHEMRRREQEARTQPQPPPQANPGGMFKQRGPEQPQSGPLQPRMQDSSRMAFQSAEYRAEQDMQSVQPDDELSPQGSFLKGPPKQGQRDVVQTPMPADYETQYVQEPPPDDLGYERPVDFGDSGQGSVVVNDEEPVARESAAHDEMEQRAGYLLWLQGVITREEVDDALAEGQVSEAAYELLMDNTFTDQVTLYRFLARHESLAPVDLERVRPSEAALAVLRPAIARSYRVVPIEKVGELLLVAAAFPFDPRRLLELRRLTASKVKLFVVTEDEIDDALARYYPPASAATLRSPKPTERAESYDDSAITGEGVALEENYDPTLSGDDSGLYAPIDPNAPSPPGDVGMSELDESGFDSQSETGRHAAVSESDLDESSLDGTAAAEAADELDLGGGDVGESPREESGIDSGPEDLDPFGE